MRLAMRDGQSLDRGTARRSVVKVSSEPPSGEERWLNTATVLEAGFFHTPASLALALPEGDPLFLSWMDGERTAGIAVGVVQRCRLGGRSHVRLATAPALAPDMDPVGALAALVRELRSRGVAEVHIPSFDGAGVLPLPAGASAQSERIEYVVRLDRREEDITAAFSSTQRRHLRRANRSELDFSAAARDDASRLLYEVQRTAADRGTSRGNRFSAERMGPRQTAALTLPSAQAGAAVFVVATRGELLGAALVGWSAKRAFYLRGGSTEAGYRSNVAAWLHWRIMQTLRHAGVESYNLGGTPAGAVDPGHPQHGLHRFKCDLGAHPIPCRGLHWPLRPAHLALHRAVNGLGQMYRRRVPAMEEEAVP